MPTKLRVLEEGDFLELQSDSTPYVLPLPHLLATCSTNCLLKHTSAVNELTQPPMMSLGDPKLTFTSFSGEQQPSIDSALFVPHFKHPAG